MLKYIVIFIATILCSSCEANIPEAKKTNADINCKSNMNGHTYFECQTHYGRIVLVHDPDCEKCQKNLEETIRKVLVDFVNKKEK